jgi:hypothetical protein
MQEEDRIMDKFKKNENLDSYIRKEMRKEVLSSLSKEELIERNEKQLKSISIITSVSLFLNVIGFFIILGLITMIMEWAKYAKGLI